MTNLGHVFSNLITLVQWWVLSRCRRNISFFSFKVVIYWRMIKILKGVGMSKWGRIKYQGGSLVFFINLSLCQSKLFETNLSYFQNKFNVDVLMISETKIDDSFPVGQFLIEGFCTTYRLDRNSKVEAFCCMLGKTFLQT